MSGFHEKHDERPIWSCSLVPEARGSEKDTLEAALREKSLPLWEDARALRRYLRITGLSQAECARRLERSQAAIANRLRVLRLPEEVIDLLREARLTERHARALLRLPSPEMQRRAAAAFAKQEMTVAEAESLVDALLSPQGAAAALSRERRGAVEELWSWLEQLQKAVPETAMTLRDEGRFVVLTIRLPKG